MHSKSSSQPILRIRKRKSLKKQTAFSFIPSVQLTPIPNNQLLNKLKSRKNPPKYSLPPAQASNIINYYIIPKLLNLNQKDKIHYKTLPSLYPNQNKQMIISQLLRDKIFKVRQQIRTKKLQLNKIQGQIDQAKSKSSFYKRKFQQQWPKLGVFRNHYLTGPFYTPSFKSIKSKQKEFLQILETKSVNLRRLVKEYDLSEHYKLKYTTSTIYNSAVLLENTLMGDLLKGLFEVQKNLLNPQEFISNIQFQIQNFSPLIQNAFNFMYKQLRTVHIFVNLNSNCQQSSLKFSKLWKSIQVQVRQIKIQSKQKAIQLSNKCSRISKQNQSLKLSCENWQTKVIQLQNIQNFARKSLKRELLFRRGRIGVEEQEIMCQQCSHLFTQATNFNWSCRYHLSDWNGSMFWCCGRTNPNAEGCVSSQHLGKQIDGNNEKIQKKCVSCLQIGHTLENCPRDPNIRSNGDITSELYRLNLMKSRARSRKKKPTIVSILPDEVQEEESEVGVEIDEIDDVRSKITIQNLGKAGEELKRISELMSGRFEYQGFFESKFSRRDSNQIY